MSQYVRTTLTNRVLSYLLYLYCGCRYLSAMHAVGFIFLIIFGEVQALQATGLIFLIIFEFFVENHLLAKKNQVSMAYGLRVMIIAGNGPYFSHYFQFLCRKTQNPVSTTYGFRVLCLVHSCRVITHCRVKQVYPLIKLHL